MSDLCACFVLLAEGEASIRISLRDSLIDAGAQVVAVATGDQAIACLDEQQFDIVIADVTLPGVSGLNLLAHVGRVCPRVPVIILTAYQNVNLAVAALEQGAHDYATKPFPDEKIVRMAAHAWALTRRKDH